MDAPHGPVLNICGRLLRADLASAARDAQGQEDDRRPLRAADRAHDRPAGRNVHRKGPVRRPGEPADHKQHRTGSSRSIRSGDRRAVSGTPSLSLAPGQAATRYFRVTTPESAEGQLGSLMVRLA